MPKAGSSLCFARSCRSTSRDPLPRSLRRHRSPTPTRGLRRPPRGARPHPRPDASPTALPPLRPNPPRPVRAGDRLGHRHRHSRCRTPGGIAGTGGRRGSEPDHDARGAPSRPPCRLRASPRPRGGRRRAAALLSRSLRLRFRGHRAPPRAESEAILREMVHVTRAGGMVAVQDQDFGTLALDHPDRDLTQRIMDGGVSRMYPDPFSGRTLYGRLARLGLRDVRLAVEVFQDTKLEPYTHAMLSRRAENAVKLGIAAPRAAARWLAAVERLAAIGQFAFTLNYYAARGMKP